jgi:hypothetical protein
MGNERELVWWVLLGMEEKGWLGSRMRGRTIRRLELIGNGYMGIGKEK